jgi:hypothetical protein
MRKPVHALSIELGTPSTEPEKQASAGRFPAPPALRAVGLVKALSGK